MKRIIKTLKWFTIVLIILPVAASAAWAYAKGWPSNWHAADWTSIGALPPAVSDKPAMIRIYAARSGRWKGVFAVHHWIVVKPKGGAYNRYEVVGWGSPVRHNNYPPDGRWYSNPPQLVYDLRGAEAEKLIPKVAAAIDSYPWTSRGSYKVWPGPNSNTFVAHVLREVPKLKAEMHTAGIGKDFIGPGFTVRPVPSGTGWQVSWSGYLGAALALAEGLELHILGATVGLDFDDLAIKLPGIGRIGGKDVATIWK
ncbi:MAG: DUF3750 domain-containing protein [Rhizobiales bacterium]|nr:DUF3750 domain-containing protein [Hyphomicrobiales bacterium]